MSERVPSQNLAANLKQLREHRGLSQQAVAKRAHIPRATWSNLESGSANPTLAVLLAAAEVLDVSLEELLRAPPVSCRLYKAGELTEKRKDRVVIRELLPDPLPGLHLERLSLPAGAWMRGSPHTRGTREYLTCERGQLVLATAGERHMLDPGDVLVFPGDQRHAYHNSGDEEAVGYSALVLTAPA